ncbi:NAD(P)-binding protein [Vararia minispora EC-137]|uniref:NAD(P)-binding protein n=1 Tax=Vararia minispora EC-137 TaxID=1314806 RepID=A0ACB8QDC2_9AGAM|nr:NAD(P)-binding protein [Vararia minispora EC-137]
MSPISNLRLLFSEIPEGLPNPGTVFQVDKSTIDVDDIELEGGFVVKVLSLSLDPYMRNRMRREGTEGDMPELHLGRPVTGFGVAVVLRSENASFPAGTHVSGFMPYQEYALFGDAAEGSVESATMPTLGLTALYNEYNLPWRYYPGALGMTGQTAYYAFKDVMDPKPGETILISAAAGAVGLLAVQYAMSLGLRVIASCGSQEKVDLLQSLGVQHVINRRTDDIDVELKKLGRIDIYLDHVGGEMLEAVLYNAAMNARFIICGSITCYNSSFSEAPGVRNLWLVNRYRVTIRALVVIDWHETYLAEFYDVVPRKIVLGEIKCIESIYQGLERCGEALVDMLIGKTIGKTVVVLAEE